MVKYRIDVVIDPSGAKTGRQAVEGELKGIETAANRTKATIERAMSDGTTKPFVTSMEKAAVAQNKASSAAEQLADAVNARTAADRAAFSASTRTTQATNAAAAATQKYAVGVKQLDSHVASYLRNSSKMAQTTKEVGQRAQLTQYQLTQLSFQLNDVATGLASGQSVGQIFAQQMGQIYQAITGGGQSLLGGLKGLATTLLGMAATGGPILLVVAALGLMTKAFLDGKKESADFNNALQVTNGFAGQTVDQLRKSSVDIAAATGSSIGSTKKLLLEAVNAGHLQGQTLNDAVEISQKYAQMTGRDASDILKEFDGMRGGVAKFGAEHALQYHDLTLAQLKHIELLEKEGKQSAATAELFKLIKDQTKDQVTNYGYLEKALHGVANAASEMWNQLLSAGREKTVGDKLEAANRTAAGLHSSYNEDVVKLGQSAPEGSAARQAADKVLASRKAQENLVSALTRQSAAEQRLSDIKAKNAKTEADAINKYFNPVHDKKTPKAKEAPRDTSEETAQQLEKQYQQAIKDQLQAQYDVTTNLEKRGALQQQILEAERLASLAALEKQKADILDPKNKGLTDAQKEIDAAKITAIEEVVNGTAIQKKANAAALNQIAIIDRNTKIAGAAAEFEQDHLEILKSLARTDFDRNKIELQILDSKYKQAVLEQEAIIKRQKELGENADPQIISQAQQQIKNLTEKNKADHTLIEQTLDLAHIFNETNSIMGNFRDAIKRYDWGAAFQYLIDAIGMIGNAANSAGAAGALGVGASVVGGLVGGKTGRAVGKFGGSIVGGLGLANGIAGAAASLGPTAIGGSGLLGAGAFNALSAVASAVPWVALVVGLAGLAKAFQKPSNKGAGYDLATGNISGKSRDAETEGAVKQAGDAILAAQKGLVDDLGLKLGVTIKGLVIGSRDQSQIYTSDGRTLTAAKGDPEAAVSKALDAVLRGAEYTSEAQKKLAISALDAGKSFAEVSDLLAQYKKAQDFLTLVDDAILKFTDPKQYDLTTLKRAQDERDKSVQAMADAGFLTADQLTAVTAKLSTLKNLEFQDVLSRYGETLKDQGDRVVDAYNREVDAINDTIDGLKDIIKSLEEFDKTLYTGANALLSPEDQYNATKAAFQSTSARALAGDKEALAQLPDISQQYLDASKAYYAGTEPYFKDLAEVRSAVEAAEQLAKTQLSLAEQQLDTMKQQLTALGLINDNVKTLADELKAYFLMKNAGSGAAGAAANGNQTTPLNADGSPDYAGIDLQVQAARAGGNAADFVTQDQFNSAAYLAQNPDVAAAGVDPYQHFLQSGQYEIAMGYRQRGFAEGGVFSNSIVTRPSMFTFGQMGEKGSEAIMPLARGPQGLGVRSIKSNDDDTKQLLREILKELQTTRAATGEWTAAQIEVAAQTVKEQRKTRQRQRIAA